MSDDTETNDEVKEAPVRRRGRPPKAEKASKATKATKYVVAAKKSVTSTGGRGILSEGDDVNEDDYNP